MPVNDGADTYRQEQRQHHDHADPGVNSVRDERREQRHEGNGHRQAIPKERFDGRIDVIIRRPDADEGDAREEDEKGPALPRRVEQRPPSLAEHEGQP